MVEYETIFPRNGLNRARSESLLRPISKILVIALAVSAAIPGLPRDSHGRILRSQAQRSEFKREHPCPATGKPSGSCPGYVIDHVIPLKRGGPDIPANMQWQTIKDAKAKDKVE